MVDKTKHGGPGRGQGRKTVVEGEPTITVSVRMAKSQRKKLDRLGGAKWVRDQIDLAHTPKTKAKPKKPKVNESNEK